MGRNFWAIKKAPLSFSALLLPLRIQLQAYERVNTGVTRSSRMLLLRFLLLSLLTVLLLRAAQCTKIICKDSCCSFVEGFPVRLKALRSSYAVIRDYYEGKDDLDTSLFNRTVLDHFKTPYGCSVMNDILHFYLETVLPNAISGHMNGKNFRTPIDTIGSLFQELKRELVKCRSYFTCRKPFEISSVKNSYHQMGGKGLYKAMGELDMLFNYIEDYVASQRHKR
ncbi:interleukin-10 [Ictalurus punctatus]|uniref:Interleukin family protein n=1 Tax=Ictalurus punctatus TaxID=7998 RepID=A0A2D0PJY5_ICTPU|nr:interleukin-10 [Ictalurus punctatus]